MSKNLRGLSERKGLENGLYVNVVRASRAENEERERSLLSLSHEYLTGSSHVLGTASFYEFLSKEQAGRKAFCCNGTACMTSGKQGEIRERLRQRFGDEEIGEMSCLGHCHSNDACLINGRVSTPDGEAPAALHVGTNVDRAPLITETGEIAGYYQLADPVKSDPGSAAGEIELSGLRGRGGAGFPFHRKLMTVMNTVADRKYVVCNADEGDPGAFSDKWLLEERPHSVLFGMLVAGLITGADTGVVYIRGEYPLATERMRTAANQLIEMAITGDRGEGVKYNFRFIVVEGSGAYICGEETSLLNSLEGLRPEVRTRPPFPAVYGLFGRPTLLSNVETFANLHYILEEGGERWSSLGTVKSPGTKLVSLDGAFRHPGLYEVAMGTPLTTILNDMGGGTRYPVKAFQIGGPLGGLVPASVTGRLSMDFESFGENGFLMGHAGIVSIPEDFPLIELIRHLFEFTAAESCGKCFPCRLGSVRGTELLEAAINNKSRIDRQLFDDLLETMHAGSLCALGGGLPLPVRNALDYFKDELSVYFR